MESKFTGSTFGLFGMNILAVLLSLITLGIINGKQLTFDGNGAQLWGKFIVWLLLTIVTLGIYSFFLAIKMKKWVISHTHFA